MHICQMRVHFFIYVAATDNVSVSCDVLAVYSIAFSKTQHSAKSKETLITQRLLKNNKEEGAI